MFCGNAGAVADGICSHGERDPKSPGSEPGSQSDPTRQPIADRITAAKRGAKSDTFAKRRTESDTTAKRNRESESAAERKSKRVAEIAIRRQNDRGRSRCAAR